MPTTATTSVNPDTRTENGLPNPVLQHCWQQAKAKALAQLPKPQEPLLATENARVRYSRD